MKPRTHAPMRAPAACLAAWLLACSAPAAAQSLGQLWQDGNAAYFHGDFAGATQRYTRLIEAGVRDADVYFNAATAHARAGELGRAVLDFERCLWIRASDDGCEQGLAAAEAELGKARAQRSGEATVRARPPISEALLRPWSERSLAALVLALDALLFGLLLARRAARREGVRLGLTIAAPLTALSLAVGIAGLSTKAGWFAEGRPAVVLRDAELREGPDPRAQVRGKAYEGQRATLGRREGGYLETRLDGAESGWMKASDLAPIRSD